MVYNLKRKRAGRPHAALDTPEQRAAKCAAKYHHARIEVVRAFKKALTFEQQKLVKRLKKARDAGDDTLRIVAETTAAKSLDCDAIAWYHLDHTIQRSHKDLASILSMRELVSAPHKDAPEALRNVVARLMGSKTSKDAVADLVHKLEACAGFAATTRSKPKRAKMTPASLDHDSRTSLGPIPFAQFTHDDDDDDDDDDEEEEEEESEDSHDTAEDDKQMRPSQRLTAAAAQPTTTASAFLPSLNVGYVAAEDGSDDEGELKGLFPAQKKERKNRRGQRARRKILEAKHGRKANHLIKERALAQTQFEERVARRAAREVERTGANAVAVAEGEKNRSERREARLRPIHASWAIAKAQKAIMKQAKPEGVKISFD